MRLCEIKQDIKYHTYFYGNLTRKQTQKYLDNRLHMQDGAFKEWWKDPKENIDKGAYISTLKIDGQLQGLAIINVGSVQWFKEIIEKQNNQYELLGMVGFYTRPKFRRKGHGKRLAENLERYILKKRKSNKISVIICAQDGCHFASAFKTIKVISRDRMRTFRPDRSKIENFIIN